MTENESATDFENILTDVQDGVLRVTLNRPSKFNALNCDTLEEILLAVVDAEDDPDIGAILITGSPETKKPAFAAGADIGEMADMDSLELRAFASEGQGIFMAIERLEKPVIAAVNGLALGGGCELAMACHIRIAAEGSQFGQPEINLGLVPGFGGTQRLSRLIGRGRSLEMLLSGDSIGADEALRIGLVNRVVPAEKLLETAHKLAVKLASKAPVARARILELVSRGADMDLQQAQQMEADIFGSLAATVDTREGLAAFLEKRKAEWTGC